MGNVELVWRKSTRCDSGHCVEVAATAAAVHVRDSKDPDAGVLTFAPDTWRSFLATLRIRAGH